MNKKPKEEVEKRVRKKLTTYEWRKLRERFALKDHLTVFQREFRKHLSTLVTGAFAFVAALLWRDAIRSFLERYEEIILAFMPLKETWIAQFFVAFAVSIIAVLAIMIISKILK